jgi:hypothetical protein
MPEARDKYGRAVTIRPDDNHSQARYGMTLLLTGPPEKQAILARLSTDHVYRDASEAKALSMELARHYDYGNAAASRALLRFIDQFNPAELYPASWWNDVLQTFGSPTLAHDRIMRGVMSAVYSWSIPTREVIRALAQFSDDARLNSLGAGTGYWEFLLAKHFDVPVAATDIHLKHRFIPEESGEYATASINASDVVFLSWVPRGVEDARRVLERMATKQRLILVGEPPDAFGVAQTCATASFHKMLAADFQLVDTVVPARFQYFRDTVCLYIKQTDARPESGS